MKAVEKLDLSAAVGVVSVQVEEADLVESAAGQVQYRSNKPLWLSGWVSGTEVLLWEYSMSASADCFGLRHLRSAAADFQLSRRTSVPAKVTVLLIETVLRLD